MFEVITLENQARAAGLDMSMVPNVKDGDALDWMYGSPDAFYCQIRVPRMP